MAQLVTKFIANKAVTAPKIGSLSATVTQPLFADGSGGTAFRSILSTDIPTLNQNTTGSAGSFTGSLSGDITGTQSATVLSATSNSTLTTLSALSLPYSQITGAPAAITSLTGDVTGTGPGATATTLATVNSNVGSFGSASSVATFTVNAKGLTTAAGSTAIAITGSQVTDLTSILSAYLPLAGGTMSGAINMGGFKINSLATPTLSSDAATKGYVDAAINGLTWKGPVSAYASSNQALTGGATLTIDGYAVQNGNYVALANQTTPSQNGIYQASGIGTAYTLTLISSGPEAATAVGDAYLVLNGTVYANTAYQVNGLSPVTFIQFAGPNTYSFTAPLVLTGNTVSITQASGSTNGYLSSTDWNTFNNKQPAGSYITSLTGDGSASGPGSAAFTLATVNSNTGSFGSSTAIPNFTVNGKGLITAAGSSAVVAPAGTLSGTTLNSTVVTSSLTSVGTITSGTWNGTTIAIANGGTGQTTKQAAFDALSPNATAGDITYFNGTHNVALPIGSTGQVLSVVAGEPSWQPTAATLTVTEQTPTLSSGDITNQYYDLAHAVQGSSASVNSISLDVYGGPEQLKGTDYTVSLTGGAGGVTRITFAGDLATGGNAALISGDILMVSYSF